MTQETSIIPVITQSQIPETVDSHKKGSHQKISENKKDAELLSHIDVSNTNEIKKTPEKVVNVPEKAVNVPEKVVNVPEKVVNVPEKVVNVPEKVVNVYDKTITTLEKTTTKHEQQLEQLQESINKLQASVSNMRTDMEKLRVQVADKIPKAVLSEIEGKVNHHSKGLDAVSKKLFELQNNLTTFIQQPISHSLIDTLRKQLTLEISESIQKSLSDDIGIVKSSFDDKIDETRKMINNAKRAMFSR